MWQWRDLWLLGIQHPSLSFSSLLTVTVCSGISVSPRLWSIAVKGRKKIKVYGLRR